MVVDYEQLSALVVHRHCGVAGDRQCAVQFAVPREHAELVVAAHIQKGFADRKGARPIVDIEAAHPLAIRFESADLLFSTVAHECFAIAVTRNTADFRALVHHFEAQFALVIIDLRSVDCGQPKFFVDTETDAAGCAIALQM